jgi:hypothetical protein
MEVNERIAGHRTSVFSEENFSQIYPAMRRRSKPQAPNPKETPNLNIQRDVSRRIFLEFVGLFGAWDWGLGFPLAGSYGRHGTPGMTFLLFSQNRNCIGRVALLRERVPRSALALQRGVRAQVYPQ